MTMEKISPLSEPLAREMSSLMPLYKVLLHNDDVNTMDHVIKSIMKVFHYSLEVSERIMLEAHQNGVALCTVEPFEKAELHRDQLQSYSLISTIEPE